MRRTTVKLPDDLDARLRHEAERRGVTLVITEVASLLETRLGWQAEVRFLGDLASGSFAVEPLQASHPIRIAEARLRIPRLTGTIALQLRSCLLLHLPKRRPSSMTRLTSAPRT